MDQESRAMGRAERARRTTDQGEGREGHESRTTVQREGSKGALRGPYSNIFTKCVFVFIFLKIDVIGVMDVISLIGIGLESISSTYTCTRGVMPIWC